MKFTNAVVCDEVRKEANGKHIIIGVYPHDMLVNSFPATIAPALWIQFFIERKGEIEIEFRVRDKSQPKKRGLSALAKLVIINPDELNTMTLPPAPIVINEQGLLLFEVREKDGRWKKIREILIKQSPKPE